jgi:hypothetical protein
MLLAAVGSSPGGVSSTAASRITAASGFTEAPRSSDATRSNARPTPYALTQSPSDNKLREQVERLTDALNHRDLAAIRAQIHPTRIYVEVDNKAAYLSHSQTLVVMETFFKTRTSVTSTFDFVSDDGITGSASGTLSARKDGRSVRYHLNFGFTRTDAGAWLLTRISMR